MNNIGAKEKFFLIIIVAMICLGGCVGPADYAAMLRSEPKHYTNYDFLEIKTDKVDPIDVAEELGKSLNFKVTRSSRYSVYLFSTVGSFWGLSGRTSPVVN
ncbi:MAG: hypothetical protein FJ242_10560 [Nitrospira sp.]|nr:hypothetical protein [Nitrospira sp.]